MVSDQEVCAILEEFNHIKPIAFLQQIDISSMGIGNVLDFLEKADHVVTAGEISEYMNVSTARVAVLLRKMSDKGLIEKKNDPKDARRVLVSITDAGRRDLSEKREEILLYSRAIIEKFGKEKIMDFVAACKDIKDIVDEVKTQYNVEEK